MTPVRAAIALVRPIAGLMAHLSVDARISLLCALVAQEICTMPPAERDDELREVLRELPRILDITEAAMREALAQNARDERP